MERLSFNGSLNVLGKYPWKIADTDVQILQQVSDAVDKSEIISFGSICAKSSAQKVPWFQQKS
jgi:hypothetical protein